MLKTPLVVVNFKTYRQGVGSSGIKLLKVMEELHESYSGHLAAAVTSFDLGRYTSTVELPVLTQHGDHVGYGSHTGAQLLELAKEYGAVGTLLNHSECRMLLFDLAQSVEKARELGLITVVCSGDVPSTRAAAALNPDFVAVEPPELISGDVSVSKARPELIRDAAEAVSRISESILLCGAGVKDGTDMKKALELGAKGVLLASGVVKTNNPKDVLQDIIQAASL